jgi:hypothetical protein
MEHCIGSSPGDNQICVEGFCNEITMHFLQSFMSYTIRIFVVALLQYVAEALALCRRYLILGICTEISVHFLYRVLFFVLLAACSDILWASFAQIKQCISAQLSRDISIT